MRRGANAAALLAGLATVALLLLILADLVVTEVAESRLSTTVSRALGMEAQVQVGPWPAMPRLLTGRLTVDMQATPAEADRATEDGAGPAVRAVDGKLTGVEVEPGWQSLTAHTGRADLTLDPAEVPFGTSTATVTADDLRATFGSQGAVITGARLELLGRGASASGTDLRVVVEQARAGSRRATLTAASASLAATEDLGAGSLPLDVDGFRVDALDITVEAGTGEPTRVRATRAGVEAEGVPLEGTDGQFLEGTDGQFLEGTEGRLQQLTATIPQLTVDHRSGEPDLAIAGDGATFTVELGEQQLEALWQGPGDIELVEGRLRVWVGPLVVDVDVRADGRQLLLTPLLPPAVALIVGELPPIAVAPRLPEGVELWQATVTSDSLRLAGGGDRIVLPLR